MVNKLSSFSGQIFGIMTALAIVTTAHYFWQFSRMLAPQAMLAVYFSSFVLLAVGAHFILRSAALLSYQRHKKLTNFTLSLLCTNWGLFFAFPSLYSPYNWAWSWSNEVSVANVIRFLSGVFIVVGLVGVVVSILWLGIPRSIGQAPDLLRTNGLYGFTRNPQIVAGGFIVLGYTILRPSWYALGWLILFPILSHEMVLSEEAHLRGVFGKQYEDYQAKTCRYLPVF